MTWAIIIPPATFTIDPDGLIKPAQQLLAAGIGTGCPQRRDHAVSRRWLRYESGSQASGSQWALSPVPEAFQVFPLGKEDEVKLPALQMPVQIEVGINQIAGLGEGGRQDSGGNGRPRLHPQVQIRYKGGLAASSSPCQFWRADNILLEKRYPQILQVPFLNFFIGKQRSDVVTRSFSVAHFEVHRRCHRVRA